MRAAFETAARLPNADFMAFLVLALHRLQDGDRDGAARNLRLAMDRNPRLSAASLPGMFRFPMWSQHYVPAIEPLMDGLIDVGLPRDGA